MKKTASLMLIMMTLVGSFAVPMSAHAQTVVDEEVSAAETTSVDTEEDVSDEETTDDEVVSDEEEETDEEEVSEEEFSDEDNITLDGKMEVVDEDNNGEMMKVTRLTVQVDPTNLGIDQKSKSKLQLGVCGFDMNSEKCVDMSELGVDFSKSFIKSAKASLMDGTDVPVQVSVLNKSKELTKLTSNTDLYKPATDNQEEVGYSFYEMVVDLGSSDQQHEPITVTIDIVGDVSADLAKVFSEREDLSVARLAIIGGVDSITNIPVKLMLPEEPVVDEPLPIVPEQPTVEEVKEAKTGIAGVVLAGAVALGGTAIGLHAKRRRED